MKLTLKQKIALFSVVGAVITIMGAVGTIFGVQTTKKAKAVKIAETPSVDVK